MGQTLFCCFTREPWHRDFWLLSVYTLKPHPPRGLAACSWHACVPRSCPCHCWLPRTPSQPPPAASVLRSPGESFYTAPDHFPTAETHNQRKEYIQESKESIKQVAHANWISWEKPFAWLCCKLRQAKLTGLYMQDCVCASQKENVKPVYQLF